MLNRIVAQKVLVVRFANRRKGPRYAVANHCSKVFAVAQGVVLDLFSQTLDNGAFSLYS